MVVVNISNDRVDVMFYEFNISEAIKFLQERGCVRDITKYRITNYGEIIMGPDERGIRWTIYCSTMPEYEELFEEMRKAKII